MSAQDAKALVAQLQKDPQLRRQLQDAGAKAVETVARQQGHNVTVSELHDALREVSVTQLGKMGHQLPGGGTAIVAIASVAVI